MYEQPSGVVNVMNVCVFPRIDDRRWSYSGKAEMLIVNTWPESLRKLQGNEGRVTSVRLLAVARWTFASTRLRKAAVKLRALLHCDVTSRCCVTTACNFKLML